MQIFFSTLKKGKLIAIVIRPKKKRKLSSIFLLRFIIFNFCRIHLWKKNYRLFNWNRRATVGIVLDDGATDVAVVVAEAMDVVFELLADGDKVPVDDDEFAAFVVDIVLLFVLIIQTNFFFFTRMFVLRTHKWINLKKKNKWNL